jgi:hypothetical protein
MRGGLRRPLFPSPPAAHAARLGWWGEWGSIAARLGWWGPGRADVGRTGGGRTADRRSGARPHDGAMAGISGSPSWLRYRMGSDARAVKKITREERE